ncbi:MAG: hypothetical protein KY055_02425 [Candidatus Nealsonbacteria bacterium]|nr:hypothetical protein [Candidatus Nealsonbacteria bacterium]
MNLVIHIFIFLISCLLLTLSGSWLVGALTRIARFLGWREFVVAFFILSFAASIPELFIGITSALGGIPELSFGNIVGANVIHLTLAIALATLILKGIEIESRTVQASLVFTVIAAILPLILILDGSLSRIDGVLLILAFIFYSSWLFSKKEYFSKIYDGVKPKSIIKEFKTFIQDLGIILGGAVLLLISAQGIISSADFFAKTLNAPLPLIGILIVSLGTALPETWFCLQAARKGQSWMILGNLMGCIIVTASLVLGIVVLIHPIEIIDFSPFVMARFFLIISAFFFLLFVRTGRKIIQKEALFLLGIYLTFVLFLLVEFLIK